MPQMETTRGAAKDLVKGLTPPFLYNAIRSLILRAGKSSPHWVKLSYPPLQGVELYLDPTGSWQRKMVEGSYDSFLFKRILALKPEGKVIYDIGSHIGYHSYYFAKIVGEGGRVYAFEPNPTNIARIELILNRNQDLKKIIQLEKLAVSEKSGMIEFNVSEDIESGQSSGNFIGSANTFFNKEVYKYKNFKKTEVRTISLDEFTSDSNNGTPDIIKLDIEGAESLALAGTVKLLRTRKPVLFIEVHSMQNMFSILNLLHELSYKATIIHSEDNGIPYLEAVPNSYANSHYDDLR